MPNPIDYVPVKKGDIVAVRSTHRIPYLTLRGTGPTSYDDYHLAIVTKADRKGFAKCTSSTLEGLGSPVNGRDTVSTLGPKQEAARRIMAKNPLTSWSTAEGLKDAILEENAND